MQLQRLVGNASVQRLLQRDAKLGWDPAARHSKFKRTHHTDPNRVVEAGGVKLRNVLLQGLKHGYTEGEPSAEDTVGQNARGDTVENAAGKAVVWMPETFNPADASKPVEVLLHLHGYGAGYRELASGSDYAENLKPGQTRDEDLYRLPDQVAANMKATSRQVVAVLPQGRARPLVKDKKVEIDMFGDIPSRPGAYLDEVFAALKDKAGIDKPSAYQLVMSGHSGSGWVVMAAANKLDSTATGGVNETAGGSKVTLAEIVLFDAIQGKEINTVDTWLKTHIQADVAALTGKSKPDARQLEAYFAKRTRFRGYYSPNYKDTYEDLRKKLATALAPVADLGPTAQTYFEWQYMIAGPIGTKGKDDNAFAPHERLLAAKNDAQKAGLIDEMLDITSAPPKPATPTPPTPAPPTTAPPTTAPPKPTTTAPSTPTPAQPTPAPSKAETHRQVDPFGP